MYLKDNYRLQENFRINEFLAESDRQPPSETIKLNLYKLSIPAQKARYAFKQEVRVTSGFRGSNYNLLVGGDNDSFHLDGLAIDFELLNDNRIEDYSRFTIDSIFTILFLCGFINVTIYVKKNTKNIMWIHADIGTKRTDGKYGWKDWNDECSYRIKEV